ncbi:tetratricopeptide repeat protein [Sorangium sp. So ce315]|uniref:tetratricopeptide repeat protein n=1 Tax=Sorangium sp. So ce315 TaxID=3133299 RepID=UPI003F63FC3D
MTPPHSLRLALLLALTLPATPAVAVAQQAQPAAQARDAARSLAYKGQELFDAGRYEEALAAFREAEALFHAPPLLQMIARSSERLGRLLEARSLYQRIVDEPLAADAPRAFQQAQAESRVDLAALAPRIPTVEVAVRGAAPGEVVLTLDGERIDQTTPVERDPGSYTLVASVPGRNPVTRTIRLNEGTRERVTLDLPPPAAAPRADSASAAPGGDIRTAVLLGGGIAAGVGVLAGVAFTVVANGKASDAERQRGVAGGTEGGAGYCSGPALGSPTQQCEKLSSVVDDKYLFSNVALWSFIVGGAAALGTLGYYLVATPQSTTQEHVRVVPIVTPGGGGIAAGGVF